MTAIGIKTGAFIALIALVINLSGPIHLYAESSYEIYGSYDDLGFSEINLNYPEIIFDAKSPVHGTPAVRENMVIFQTWGRGLYCISTSGEMLWNLPGINGMSSPVFSMDGSLIFIGDSSGFFYSVFPNGTVAGVIRLSDLSGGIGITSKALIVSYGIYVAYYHDGVGGIVMLDYELNIIWNTPINAVYYSSPVIHNDTLYISSAGTRAGITWQGPGSLYFINALTGVIQLEIETPPSFSTPLIYNDKIFFLDRSGGLKIMDTTGSLEREVRVTSGSSSPVIYGDIVYFGTGDFSGGQGGVMAFESNGDMLWNTTIGPVQSSPALYGDFVYVTTNEPSGKLYCLWKDNGTVRNFYTPNPHNFIISSPVIYSENNVSKLILSSDNGFLYIFSEYGNSSAFLDGNEIYDEVTNDNNNEKSSGAGSEWSNKTLNENHNLMYLGNSSLFFSGLLIFILCPFIYVIFLIKEGMNKNKLIYFMDDKNEKNSDETDGEITYSINNEFVKHLNQRSVLHSMLFSNGSGLINLMRLFCFLSLVVGIIIMAYSYNPQFSDDVETIMVNLTINFGEHEPIFNPYSYTNYHEFDGNIYGGVGIYMDSYNFSESSTTWYLIQGNGGDMGYLAFNESADNYVFYSSVKTSPSALFVLEHVCGSFNFSMETENHVFGRMVVSIAGAGRPNGYWTYYVNGEYASLGPEHLILNDGDEILWIFQ